MTDDLPSRLQSLEHQLSVLTEENAQLAERAEDSLLLGLISENIQNLQNQIEIFSNGLEQISILKGIPFCSCGRLIGCEIEKIASYASFSDSIDIGYPIKISKDVLTDLKYGPILITKPENISCTFDRSTFQPTAAALIPFKTQNIPSGVFLFLDNTTETERLAPMLMLLNHAVEMIASKYDNIFLLDALRTANKHLEQRVQERTIELTKANRAMQESERKYRQLVENANDAIFIVQDNRLVFFNEKTIRDLKYQREELLNRPLLDLIHPASREVVTEHYTKRVNSASDTPSTYTITALTKDKGELTVQISSVMVDWNGKPAILNFARDISDQRRLEESFHQAQKMEAIGQLASGIAHDFNNMLGGIIGAAEMLGLYLPDDAKAKKFHQTILEAAARAAGLTRKLLSFSRSSQQSSSHVNVHDVIHEAIVLLENSIDPRIKIKVSLKAAKSTVIGDPSQLQSVFLNLGINGSHAMPGGGTLFISSDITELDTLYCNYSTFDIQPGTYLEVKIRDTGIGIAPEHLGRIFEPFFTTKEKGQGTGLGLASAYGAIQQHGGAITVHSRAGTGTTFRVFFPLADAESAQQIATPILQKGRGRILVVDDEEVMRLTAKAILEELGYEVIVARNGQEGLQVYLQENAAFDLVLLDMAMPVMNGRDCFEAMRKYNPDVLVVLSSGFSKAEDLREMKDLGLVGLVRKPYSSSKLSQTIHAALHKRDRRYPPRSLR
ncbi:response regulator [Desulfopila sp. IMCC35006]|uniref:hybrid sensor histidine kinase/response regulator n=1 Tax=Desulfopila sp. IMCC35006 TaxID=2569542 RepID=UPI00142EBF86|nr:response regulator [Desulfopila sp. IMCC35006]